MKTNSAFKPEVMSDWLKQILESKRAMHKRLAAQSFSEKVKVLEKLRNRSRLIAANPLRRTS